ncbi:unnamed protein product, partial [Prorocentrum cordatum]
GPAPRNLPARAAFGALVDAAGVQWVMGGGLNMGAEQLCESGVVDRLKGVIARPSEGMCKVPKREASTRDYVIASRRLAQTERATVENDLALRARCSPHFPVSCWLGKSAPACKASAVGQDRALAAGHAAVLIEWPIGPDLEGNAGHRVIDAHWGVTAKAWESNLNRCHGFADGDLARRQSRFQTEQFWEVALVPVRKPPRGAPTKRATAAEWLRYRLQELARLATGASGGQVGTCHERQKQLKLNKAYQEAIDIDLLPLTAAGDGAPRARPDGAAADDGQNAKRAIAILVGANGALKDGAPHVEYWALKAGEVADQGRRAALGKVTKEWGQRVQAHSVGGTGPLHKLTKPSTHWAPIGSPPSSPAAPRCGGPRRSADQVLGGFEEVWRRPTRGRDPRQERPPPFEPKLAPLAPAEACLRCAGFKRQTGLGAGQWRPRLWAAGGAEGIRRIVDMLGAVEGGAPWPSSQSDILFCNRPKAEGGGMRCLGLPPKAATADDESCAITLLGLVKCLECVGQWKVWEAGRNWGFPARLPRAILRIYGVARRAVLGRAATEDRRWLLAASSAVAPVALEWVIDAIQLGNSLAKLCLFFDDLSIARVGERRWVTVESARMVGTVADRLVNELEMPAPPGREGETPLLAAPAAPAKDIEPAAKMIGIRAASHAEHPGIAVRAGRRRRVSAVHKRTLRRKSRGKEVARVRRAGGRANELVTAAAAPSILYGARVVGAPAPTVQQLRQAVASSVGGSVAGRPAPSVLPSEGMGPARFANAGPVAEWASAWEEAARDPSLADRLAAAWKRWNTRLSQSPRPWTLARGPAGAFWAAARRLGWQSPAPFSLAIGVFSADSRLADAWCLRGGRLRKDATSSSGESGLDAGARRQASPRFYRASASPLGQSSVDSLDVGASREGTRDPGWKNAES